MNLSSTDVVFSKLNFAGERVEFAIAEQVEEWVANVKSPMPFVSATFRIKLKNSDYWWSEKCRSIKTKLRKAWKK